MTGAAATGSSGQGTVRAAALAMGLLPTEYETIVGVLGREPTMAEAGMYAVMWSEHCGYKYSRPVLALFRTYRETREAGALENAGMIPLDDNVAIVFKVESHNHPSAVEPFQGAATGVGGILRDIFTMGARPIASLNSLRFGPLDSRTNRYLFERVVAGIGHYGNCVGVPTVGGEVAFDACYSGNPLVNAMAIGAVDRRHVAHAAARGLGNSVVFVGSATGRDGIHGATFASVEIGPDSDSRRPNVQMGDPFMEKLLIEATLEALATGYIVGIQDMGAAGLTCSTCEMAAKAGTGMDIDVRKVPLRDAAMTPYEIMLSESQERMLCVVEAGREADVLAIFEKWGLHAAVIGTVTDDSMVRVRDGDILAAEVPAASLADDCPTYHLKADEPAYIAELRRVDTDAIPEPAGRAGYEDVLMRLLDSPTIASKRWVSEQYDSTVQTGTVSVPGAEAAVLRVPGSTRGIAAKLDCCGRYCYLDPYVGGQIAVCEAARNVASVGATPAGITDCLNFANPEKPDGFWQFRRAVEGIAAAADALDLPVVSGNVSFYNETPQAAIYPTPVIGVVGTMDHPERACAGAFRAEGDSIVILTAYRGAGSGFGGSEYLAVVHGLVGGSPPEVDVQGEQRLINLMVEMAASGLVQSCRDVSSGGLACCIAEAAILGEVGAQVLLKPDAARPSARLFGECQGRAVATVRGEDALRSLTDLARHHGIEAEWAGTVGGDVLRIAIGVETLVEADIAALRDTWESAIPRRMDAPLP